MSEDKASTESKIPDATVSRRKRQFSPIWIVPVVAALLGTWLVWHYYAGKGPVAIVRFETAEGVVAGKTKVERRSVQIGVVETVRLSEDLNGVVMELRMDLGTQELLKEDTQFWVVRPRVGGAGISGLGTIVSGAYIELDPGLSSVAEKEFVGLEQPPVTPQGIPGLRVRLLADKTGSLGPGSSVSYKGITVGRVEDRTFDFQNDQVAFDLFIDEKFSNLVSSETRFWNTTGVDMELSAEGFQVRTGSLESLISGGVGFDTPNLNDGASPVEDGTVFPLYANMRSVEEVVLKPRITYLLMFKDSVRGLNEGATVEFRGIPVGTVSGISFDYAPDDPDRRVPVLIQLDPSAISNIPSSDRAAGVALVEESVKKGLRATLKPGNLLTGQLLVSLKVDPDAEPAEVGKIGKFRTLPTVSSGLARLEDKLVVILDKIQQLPLDNMLDKATDALSEIESAAQTLQGAASEMETLLASDGISGLPDRLDATLLSFDETLAGFDRDSVFYQDLSRATDELEATLRSIKLLADSLERKPNSLIFGRGGGKVKPPRARP